MRRVPENTEALKAIHGMGDLRVQNHGSFLLGILKPHTAALQSAHSSMHSTPKEDHKTNSKDNSKRKLDVSSKSNAKKQAQVQHQAAQELNHDSSEPLLPPGPGWKQAFGGWVLETE